MRRIAIAILLLVPGCAALSKEARRACDNAYNSPPVVMGDLEGYACPESCSYKGQNAKGEPLVNVELCFRKRGQSL